MTTMATSDPLVELVELEFGHGGRALLPRPLSLAVRRGQLWAIVGPNGAGKSTLVQTMIGLLPPVRGRVQLGSPAPRFGYVPQRHTVPAGFPLRALDVVLLGRTDRLGLFRRPAELDRRRARAALARVGLGEVAARRFAALSGGQQQRVLIARALASEPDALVLDEPTEGMDLTAAADLLALLRTLADEGQQAVLLVGHHLDELLGVADRLVLLSREAGVVETGSVEATVDGTRLSLLYGRPIVTHRFAGRLHVQVEGVR